MEFCSKCGEQIASLEPSFKLGYGFMHYKDFIEDDYLIIHLECLRDHDLMEKVIEHLRNN